MSALSFHIQPQCSGHGSVSPEETSRKPETGPAPAKPSDIRHLGDQGRGSGIGKEVFRRAFRIHCGSGTKGDYAQGVLEGKCKAPASHREEVQTGPTNPGFHRADGS